MEKSSRPIRNRKQSRRIWPTGDITHRPVKRLFTPDIKKMLKEWLIRRRDNPYPSRDEKKALAHETGLTYTQICNWFANWRRKLKNSGKEPVRRSWGNLIKNYNTSAKGNVEQFSISSSDSIWGEEDNNINKYINDIDDDDDDDDDDDNDDPDENDEDNETTYSTDSYGNNINSELHSNCKNKNTFEIHNNYLEQYNREPYYPPGYYFMDPNYQYEKEINSGFQLNQQINLLSVSQLSSLEELKQNHPISELHQNSKQQPFSTNTKYKHQMMEKYLKDTNNYNESTSPSSSTNTSSSPELSKWLESTAKFTPNKNNYIEWNNNLRAKTEKKMHKFSENCTDICDEIHQKEELEAAEALTNLACNYRLKMMNTTENNFTNL